MSLQLSVKTRTLDTHRDINKFEGVSIVELGNG
jgi:hypothetical protein